MGFNALEENIEISADHPGGRYILTDEEMKEMWKRIDKKKLDKREKS